MSVKIQIRRGTATEWSNANPTLAAGELGYDSTNDILKVGDGVTAWGSLAEADNQSAAQVTYSQTGQTYALGANVQAAIYAIDDELIAQDGRLDIIEGDANTAGSVAKALQDAKDYADAQDAVYDSADAITFDTTDQTYAIGNDVQSTIEEIDDELISLDSRLDSAEGSITNYGPRLDVIEADDETAGSIAKALKDAKDYADAEIIAAKLAIGSNFAVADIATRDSLSDLTVGDIVYVADDGDAKWAQYIVYSIDPSLQFGKIMDQDILLNAISASSIKTTYESNADTNAFTDALLSKLNGIEPLAKDDQDADEVPYVNTTSQLTATDVQAAIDEVVADLVNYEPADATILKDADIGVNIQAYDANTVVDSNYETFDSSATYANLRAQATTAADVGLGNVTNESKVTMFTDPTFTGAVTVRDPLNATDAANKRYVDEVAEGLRSAPAVEVATTANLAGTYDNGTAGVGATLNLGVAATLTIDGDNTWSLYDGILLKDQTTPAENGRYFVSQIGDGTTDWILTRCPICDEADEIPGRYVFVKGGTANAGTGWVQTVDDPDTFVVGTDDIDVYQFSGAGTYTAGNGLTLTGTEFALSTAFGDTVNPYGSKAEHYVLAAPTDEAGIPVFRLLVSDDLPDLDASKIATGTLNVNRVPDLSANKITTDTLNADRIPTLAQSKVTDLETDLADRVVGPASATNANFATFDGTTGKLVADSGFSANSFAHISIGSTEPSSPSAGDLWFNNDVAVKNLFFYDGTDWIGVNTYQ